MMSYDSTPTKSINLAGDPRKRVAGYPTDEMLVAYDEDSSCSGRGCLKRSTQEEKGPFWANRGKRDPILEDKPCWFLVRQKDLELEEPPLVAYRENDLRMRDRRAKDDDLPFFAARGKKQRSKNDNQL